MKTAILLILLTICLPVTAKSIDLDTLQYDATLTGVEYPYEVKQFKVQSQAHSLDMAYMYIPASGAKEVVVLMHGKNFNSAYWQTTAEYLQSQGYGVLMPDQIGFGKSSKPVDYQYSFAALASHTKALMDSLGIARSIVVGHSMGGMVASRFALMYPNITTRLVLVNPIGLENYLAHTEYKDVEFFYQQQLKTNAKSIQTYQQKNYYDGKWNARYSELTHALIGLAQGPDKDAVAKVNARTSDMLFTQPTIEEFQYLQIPTRLIIGTRDRTAPGRNWQRAGDTYELGRYDLLGERVMPRLKNGKLFELSNLGHLPHIEDFERFKAVFEKAIK